MDWIAKLFALMAGIPLGFSGLWLVALSVFPQFWYVGGSVRRRRAILIAGLVLLAVSIGIFVKVF